VALRSTRHVVNPAITGNRDYKGLAWPCLAWPFPHSALLFLHSALLHGNSIVTRLRENKSPSFSPSFSFSATRSALIKSVTRMDRDYSIWPGRSCSCPAGFGEFFPSTAGTNHDATRSLQGYDGMPFRTASPQGRLSGSESRQKARRPSITRPCCIRLLP